MGDKSVIFQLNLQNTIRLNLANSVPNAHASAWKAPGMTLLKAETARWQARLIHSMGF